jgi:dinuclear metal center YbgI/SA1388 family protein
MKSTLYAKNVFMLIQDIIAHLETIAPPAYQESYDNAGLIVGNKTTAVTGILTCLDSTEAIIEEAIRYHCNLIVAHHPIVFRGLKTLTGSNYIERVLIKAIQHNIAIYAIHTNLDNVYHSGVNAKIAERLSLKNTQILDTKKINNTVIIDNQTYTLEAKSKIVGAGMVGNLEKPLSEAQFMAFLKSSMKVNTVRHTQFLGKNVQKVAVCGGAGGFLLQKAIAQGADVFVTADYKYHEFFDADGKILICDIGHYESEQFTIELLVEIISEKFRNFAVRKTGIVTNPVFYA